MTLTPLCAAFVIPAPAAQWLHYGFEWAALLTGLAIYRWRRMQTGAPGLLAAGMFAPLLGALLGAAIGNKLVAWFDEGGCAQGIHSGLALLLGGQSMVGGLLGGWIGVEAGKRVAGIAARTGDDYVLPVLVALVVGRVGCFLAGLPDGTCGNPTSAIWGVDFGDGIPRHPTQLYEIAAAGLAAATWPRWRQRWTSCPGLSFRVTMIGYLSWRLLIDFLKPVPHAYALNLSGIQWVCIVSIVAIAAGLVRDRGRGNA